jgi:hypothetical protein
MAVLDLDRPESMLFRASVAESLAVLAGDRRMSPDTEALELPDLLTYWRAL